MLHIAILDPALPLDELIRGVSEGKYWVDCDELVGQDGPVAALADAGDEDVIEDEVVAWFDGDKECQLKIHHKDQE